MRIWWFVTSLFLVVAAAGLFVRAVPVAVVLGRGLLVWTSSDLAL